MNTWTETYGQRGLKIIAIHSNGSGKDVGNVVDSWDIVYPVADDSGGDTWGKYGVRATPTWALIGADGTLVHRQVGAVTTAAAVTQIEALLTS